MYIIENLLEVQTFWYFRGQSGDFQCHLKLQVPNILVLPGTIRGLPVPFEITGSKKVYCQWPQ